MKGVPLEPNSEEELIDGLPPALARKLEDTKKTCADEESKRSELKEAVQELDTQVGSRRNRYWALEISN